MANMGKWQLPQSSQNKNIICIITPSVILTSGNGVWQFNTLKFV